MLGGAGSQGIRGRAIGVGQVGGDSGMAGTCVCCQDEEGSTQGQWPLPAVLSGSKLSLQTSPEARHLGLSACVPGAFRAPAQRWSPERASPSVVSLHAGLLGGVAAAPCATQPLAPPAFTARCCGDFSSPRWDPGLGSLVRGRQPRHPSWFSTAACGTESSRTRGSVPLARLEVASSVCL